MGKPDPSLTPEQQLLSLIEGGGKQGEGNAGEQAAGAPGKTGKKASGPKSGSGGPSLLSIGVLRGKLSYLQEQVTLFFKQQKGQLSLRKANRIARIVGFVIASILTVILVYDINSVYQENDQLSGIEQKERAEMPLTALESPSTELFKESDENNIFLPYDKRAGDKKVVSADGASQALLDITKDLKLTGISISENDPSKTYCMIEDLKKNITNFLKVGDSISGLTVERIDPEGVLLKSKDENVELR